MDIQVYLPFRQSIDRGDFIGERILSCIEVLSEIEAEMQLIHQPFNRRIRRVRRLVSSAGGFAIEVLQEVVVGEEEHQRPERVPDKVREQGQDTGEHASVVEVSASNDAA